MSEYDDLLNDDYDIDETASTELNVDVVKTKIPTYDSLKLCEMIACDRYLGFNKEITICCMQELSKRREEGDSFAFEDEIDKLVMDLPDLNMNIPDIQTVLRQIVLQESK